MKERMKNITFLVLVLMVFGITATVKTASAATQIYYMPVKSNCDGKTYTTAQYVALVTSSGNCSEEDKFRKSYNGYRDILIGYLSNGGYVSDTLITGQSSGNSLTLKSRNKDGTGYIKLVEVDPSTGTVIQVLDEMTVSVPDGQTVRVQDISSLSGLVEAGNSFGILLGMQINGEVEVLWGHKDKWERQQWFTVDEGPPPDPTPPAVGTVTPSNTDTGTHVDEVFDLSAALSDPDSDVTSCDYCASTDGTCDTEWASATLSGSSPNWTCTQTNISGFSDGTVLTLNIRGRSIGGTGEGLPVTRTVDSQAPQDGILTASPGNGQITLTWTEALDSGSGLAEYKLVGAAGTTPPSDCTGTAIYQGTDLSYNDTGLINGQSYAYRLCAIDNLGKISEGVTAVTMPVDDPNKTIVDGSLAKPGSNKITVSSPYTKDDNGNNYIIVSYSVSGSGVWTSVCDFTGSHMASPYICLIEGLTNGQAYDVQVDWIDPDGLYGTDPEMFTVTPQQAEVMHNSVNTGSTKWASEGGWGVAGGKYGEFTCGTCHRPNTTNIKRIKTSITTPDPGKGALPGDGHVIIFDRTSGNPGDSGVMGDDSRADKSQSSNICELCHTYDAAQDNGTKLHAYDMTAGGDPGHFNASDCIDCHPHSTAFKPAGDCYSCHKYSMANVRRQVTSTGGDFEKAYHHVSDGSSSEIVTAEACMVCHGDLITDKGHPTGDPLPADPNAELMNQDTGAYITYDGTGASIEAFCTSCHDADGSTINGSMPFEAATGGVVTNSPMDIGWTAGMQAHSYGNGNAEGCIMCHGNYGAADTTLDPKANMHGSDTEFMLRYNNYTPGAGKLFCYNCHDGSVAGEDIQTAFNMPYNHAGAGDDCQLCHMHHRAEPGLHVAGSTNLSDMIGGVNKGNGINYQYEICFDCHNATITKSVLASETEMDTNFGGGTVYQSNWNTIPDIQTQFSTSNYAYHPLFAAGRNQPANSLNSVWDSSSYRKDDSAPGGPYDGLDNNFVDGWVSTSLVTCSDCHDNSGTGARGPHGSGQPWILNGIDTAVTVTTAGAGTFYPNQDSKVDTTKSYIAANLCVNCHRGDVYGWGANITPADTPNNQDFARVGHLGSGMKAQCTSTHNEAGKGGYRNIGCMDCHGGGEVGGIHGSNYGLGGNGSDEIGKRFMNGNSWDGHTLGTSSVTCYTGTPPAIGTNMSSCNQHSGGKNVSSNYTYDWQ